MTDFDSAAAAFTPMFSTSAKDTTAFHTSSAPLDFPCLPASLLDQAPEYEYSVHTRMNVFKTCNYSSYIPSFTATANNTFLLAPRNSTLPMESTSDFDDAVLAANVSGLTSLTGPLVAALADAGPPVLHPGYAANMTQQHRQGQRLSLEDDDMYEAQSGSSRAVQGSRDAFGANNPPYGHIKPALHAHCSFTTMAATAGFSASHFNPELRRLSTGAGPGPNRGPSRDPVVPRQNVGRARLMSWKSGRADAGEQKRPWSSPDSRDVQIHFCSVEPNINLLPGAESGASHDGENNARGTNFNTDA
ncbi:hypothetical protein EX895_005450 [Sporisorium graminicola]|uniref:Uncharacterized protein n=1 Tax=Sporisorium graminicola TaxID=280036 RepID=A0A4V6EV16_9BASI|nr:hypothetical protein EX895_005450 [Sporisorium graminicola]TKY85909.1 hypothetical protein EX895_005450 [Sporisorium graminicola]